MAGQITRISVDVTRQEKENEKKKKKEKYSTLYTLSSIRVLQTFIF